jgi:dTDP-4-dehydrorhamnose reductase
VKILITGANGMLGQDVARAFRSAGHQVTPTDLPEVDITDPASCAAAVAGHDWVVNTAAYTAVDDAESKEGLAFLVNAVGPAVLARAARAAGARMVQVSTDYVFAGEASSPYAEDAPLAPRSAYGRTKAAGEWAVRAECPEAVIVRTAWLYGPGGPNFVKTMARLAGERETVSVVDDQRGQPTTTADLARFITAVVDAGAPAGVYHGTCEGETTWFGFTQAIFEDLGLDPARVLPTTSDTFVRPAPRPAYSVLGHDRSDQVGVARLPHWRDALRATIRDVVAMPGP